MSENSRFDIVIRAQENKMLAYLTSVLVLVNGKLISGGLGICNELKQLFVENPHHVNEFLSLLEKKGWVKELGNSYHLQYRKSGITSAMEVKIAADEAYEIINEAKNESMKREHQKYLRKNKQHNLLPMQHGMLLHSLIGESDKKALYIIQVVFSLDEKIDIELFKQAWTDIINRHDALKIHVSFVDDENYKAVVADKVVLPIKYFDFSYLEKSEKKASFQKILSQDYVSPFDLSVSPLMRFYLFKFSNASYRVIWSFHHMLMDMARSGKKIVSEFFSAYEAAKNGVRHTALAVTPYSTVSSSLPNLNASDIKKYWGNLLRSYEATSFSSLSNSRSKYNDKNVFCFKILEKKYQNLKMFADQHLITVNTIFLGAVGLLLCRYLNTADVVFGTTRAYPKEFIKDCVGLFINVLPVRTNINAGENVIEYLKGIRTQQNFIRKYVYTPLHDIQAIVNQSTLTQFFDTMVDFKPYFKEVELCDDSENKSNVSFNVNTNYAMVFAIEDRGGFFEVKIHYSSANFPCNYISQLAQHFQTIINDFISNPNIELCNIQMLSVNEEYLLLDEWNNVGETYEYIKPVHKYFEEHAKDIPNATAISCEGEEISYDCLNKKANQIAFFLERRRFKKETMIAVCMDRGIAVIATILGILKAGCCYVSIDFCMPTDRIKTILYDCNAEIVFVNKHIDDGLNIPKIFFNKLINVSRIFKLEKNIINVSVEINANNLAYVLFTSGSTGQPKGVLIEHGSLTNMALSHINSLKISSRDNVLQFASLTFDVSIAEWASALLIGATLNILPKNSRYVGEALVKQLSEKNITVALLPCSVIKTLPKSTLPSLRVLVSGGEKCLPSLVDRWAIGREFFNAYGPTETTVCVTMGKCNAWQKVVSIGKPIQNTKVYVLDFNLNLVPVGVIGELYIGGANLARGYLNDESLTKQKFISNPFSSDPTDCIYKTGDFVRWLDNGELEYINRVDDQIKIRGFRVEVGEIENVIISYDNIKQVVVAKETDELYDYLVAYILLKDKKNTLNVPEIREFLLRKLHSYMVPEQFVFIDQMPLTANGKIDIKALPATQKNVSEMYFDQFLNSSKSIEQKVMAIFKKLLKQKELDKAKNFFELGAHSLIMLNAANLLSKQLNCNVNPVVLFEYPTVKQLSQYLSQNL